MYTYIVLLLMNLTQNNGTNNYLNQFSNNLLFVAFSLGYYY